MAAENPDPRSRPRANVFLMAALSSRDLTVAVRVRNLSVEGALLEGPDLPDEGQQVLLRRGSLSTKSKIAWRRESQCGIRFEQPILVAEWVRRAGPKGQQKIDRAVAEFRGSSIGTRRLVAFSEVAPQTNPLLVSAELLKVCERIAALPYMSDELADELLKIESLARSMAPVGVRRS
jgi:hypothetical protein